MISFRCLSTFRVPVDTAACNHQPAGMPVSFASTDKLYFRTEVPALDKPSHVFEKTGWQSERGNVQVRYKLNDAMAAGAVL